MVLPFYLKVAIGAFVVWLIIFWRRKDQWKEMLFVSLLFALFGPIQELWYTKDYWHPFYIGQWPWIEDILFGFSMAGIAAVLYEIVFRKKEFRGENPHVFVFLSASFFGTVGGLALFSEFMNSIYAAILGFLIGWVMVIAFRRDLFVSSVYSAILVVILTVIGYSIVLQLHPSIVADWWYIDNISGIMLLGIPIEEYLWFTALGLIMAHYMNY